MIRIFGHSFLATFLSVLQIFVVIFLAGLAMRRRLITQEQVTALSRVTIVVFLPCMIFANVVHNLKPTEFPSWWVLPLAALFLSGLGIGLGALFFARELPAKKNLLALTGFQNAGYLVLPVGFALYPKEFERFALYDFLFVLGFNLLLWSLGKFLATERNEAALGWRDFLTPPFFANLAALILVFSGGARFLPRPVLDAVGMLGNAAVPVATFVLGAVLGSIPLHWRSVWKDAWRVLSVKMLLLPALTFAILLSARLATQDPLLARFFLIQAAAAPAVGLIMQVRSYGGDEEKVGSLMLLAYLVCTVTLPAWLALFDAWGVS